MSQETVSSKEVQIAVKKKIDDLGASGAAKFFNVSRESIIRVSGGVPVRSGTLAMVKSKLK